MVMNHQKEKMKTKTTEVKEHSEFGGSQAERIINCPASVKASRGIPRKNSDASDEGTAAHACLEFLLRNRKKLRRRPTRIPLIKYARKRWDKEMIEHALDAVAWVEDQLEDGDTLYIEQKLDTSAFTTKKQGSTLDIAIAKWKKRLLIIADYKYGKYPVVVKKNAQLIYYGLGMLLKLKAWSKFDNIQLTILQPRAHHKKGDKRHSKITVKQAIRWGRMFRGVVKIALGKNPPFNVGDKHCFFCPAKPVCPAMKEHFLIKEFDD